ncbi:MAG TPA: type VI secretion system tube protein Hcp [Vicinamibacterales bacterium]|nr:type VI secretion system tube protein Hcp [Vicinamibacterales bacterium]
MKRSGFKGLVMAGLMAASVASSTSVVSASDIFLKIGDIKGESTDDKHKGEIDVLSWSWGTSTGTGKVRRGTIPAQCIQDLELTKLLDSATPQLILQGLTGETAKEATLTMRKAGKGQQEFLVIKMNDVMVTSYHTGGDAGSESQLTDHVVLNFSSIDIEYRPQRADGSIGQAVAFPVVSACQDKK